MMKKEIATTLGCLKKQSRKAPFWNFSINLFEKRNSDNFGLFKKAVTKSSVL